MPTAPTPAFDPDLLVLGVVAHLVAGLLYGLSVGKGRPRRLLMELLGGTPRDLDYLRDAIQAKARGQAGAAYFSLGSLLLLLGFLDAFGSPGADPRVQALGAAGLVLLAAAVLAWSDRGVARRMRRYLRDYLQQHPYPLEENVNLAREIGELFSVPHSPDETLESYVRKVRQAVGMEDPGTGRRGRGLLAGAGRGRLET